MRAPGLRRHPRRCGSIDLIVPLGGVKRLDVTRDLSNHRPASFLRVRGSDVREEVLSLPIVSRGIGKRKS
jgi:hypothetical protein